MREFGNVVRQSVSLTTGSKREIASMMRLTQPAVCELIIERDGELIRYSSVEPTLVNHELWLQAAGHAQLGDSFAVLYDAYFEGEVMRCLSVFQGGVSVYDGPFSDLPAARLTGLSFYFVDQGLELEEFEAQYLDCSDVDTANLYTTNVKIKLAKYKQYFVMVIIAILTVTAAIGIYKFLDRPQVVVVKDIQVQEVDPYSDYRKYVGQKNTFEGVSQSFQLAREIVRTLPFGWSAESIELQGQMVRSTVLYSGGSYVELERFKRSLGEAGRYFTIDGQIAHVEVPVIRMTETHDWTNNIVSSSEVRHALLIVSRLLGGTVRTKMPDQKDLYSVQVLEVSFDGVGATSALEVVRLFAKLPVFVNSMSLDLGGETSDSKVVVEVEIVGNGIR